MKKQIETNKHRIFFYGTLVPVLVMFGFMYSEYVDGRQIIIDSYNTTNRQIELLTINHQDRLDDLSMRHMAITHKLQCSQQQDIDALITYYSDIIYGIENDKN